MKPADIPDDAAFGPAVAAGDSFVLFYSAWCPFCSSFAPAYARLAGEGGGTFLKADLGDIPLAEDRFSIEVVPTVLFFRGGKVARRLDGLLGRGLSEKQLRDFAGACSQEKKP